MKKQCDQCERESVCKGKCQYHYRMPSMMNPKAVKKVNKPIPMFSAKRLKELSVYRPIRDKYLKDNPVCQFKGCGATDVQLHHKRGRIGDYLINTDYFCALCDEHHRWAENHPNEAKELGLSGDRL